MTSAMITFNDLYRIGRIGKPHGVHGEVQLFVDDDVFDRTDTPYVFLDIDGLPVPFFFKEYRYRSEQSLLAVFEDIDTEQAARRLTGCTVWFERSLADDNNGDEPATVVGYRLINDTDRQEVGVIRSINDSTANILFEVEKKDGGIQYIPVVEEWITATDHEQKTITMHLPEGLLDI